MLVSSRQALSCMLVGNRQALPSRNCCYAGWLAIGEHCLACIAAQVSWKKAGIVEQALTSALVGNGQALPRTWLGILAKWVGNGQAMSHA